MFCPNCGAKTSVEQKFCRACGLGLEKIALSITEQIPTRADDSLPSFPSEKERLERWGMVALSVFGAGVLALLLFFIGYKEMYLHGKILKGLAFLGLMIMGACGLISAILFAKAQEAGSDEWVRAVRETLPAGPLREAILTSPAGPEMAARRWPNW